MHAVAKQATAPTRSADWFERATIGSLPERAARRWGSREALCFKGQRWSFADLSDNVMQGYYNRPEATAAAIDENGWMHTGDMGLFRRDGHLRFMGRYKDMLKIGGENVDPMEVEAFLMAHPGVNLAAVVSYPDERLSEVAVAFVRREPGHAITEKDVLAHCRGRIASFKTPRRVLFLDDFPTTSSGKIQKVKLREAALRLLDTPNRSGTD